MSVMTLSTEAFQAIHAGLVFSINNTTIDANYSETARQIGRGNKDVFVEAERMARSWITLNYKSFAARYSEKYEDFANIISLKSTKKPEPLQLIKYLHCLIYNIELTTIQDPQRADNWGTVTEQERKDYKFLEAFTQDLERGFVAKQEGYTNAKWG